MNGLEALTPNPGANAIPAYDRIPELTTQDKMDLAMFAQMPQFKTVCKLFEGLIIQARNAACDTDPSKKEERDAQLTTAHAQKKLYEAFRSGVLFEITSHIADVKQRAAQESLKEREVFEEIIIKNARGEV